VLKEFKELATMLENLNRDIKSLFNSIFKKGGK